MLDRPPQRWEDGICSAGSSFGVLERQESLDGNLRIGLVSVSECCCPMVPVGRDFPSFALLSHLQTTLRSSTHLRVH